MSTNILQLLRADGSIVVNKALAKNIGINEAILYSELVSLYLYWEGKDKLTRLEVSKDKKTKEITYSRELYFYCTVENLEENTTLSKDKQTKPLKKLKELGLIDSKVKKNHEGKTMRYFTINQDMGYILKFLSTGAEEKLDRFEKKTVSAFDSHGKEENPLSGKRKIHFRESGKPSTNNTNINNTKLNNTQSVSQPSIQVIEKETDRQTDLELQSVNRILEEQIGREELESLKERFDADLVQEIELNILEMYLQDRTTIKGDSKPKVLIQGVLNKLNSNHIEDVLFRFTTHNEKITNSKAYLQTMIYNAPYETTASMKNDIKATMGY